MSRSMHLYRPQRTSADLLEETFVAREPLLSEIVDRLAQWTPGASRQHYLLHYLEYLVVDIHGLNALIKVLLHTVLLAGVGVNKVPSLVRRVFYVRCHCAFVT